jgi:nucleoside-diphosphate-sugar epimerase
MKIFIIGSKGFIANELARQCAKKGIECDGVDLPFDMNDPRLADKLPEADAIVHLAALSRTPDCSGKMYETFDVNVMGALNVLRTSREKKIPQFIFASSEWVYPESTEEVSEDVPLDILKAPAEYALSKMVAEAALKQDWQKHGGNVTITRFAIVYGPRPKEKVWVAVESVASAVKNQDMVSVGSLATGRRFIHVEDLALGIIATLGTPGYEVFNLSGQTMVTMKDIIATSEKIFNKKVKIEETGAAASVRNPSNKKAHDTLGWSPRISLEEGIKSVEQYL